MLDLTIDPATVLASPELDALIAEKWMGWKKEPNPDATVFTTRWLSPEGCRLPLEANNWSPSTNPAHGGEARRKKKLSRIYDNDENVGVLIEVGKCAGWGQVRCHETNNDNDKGKAEALATCRAIVAALKANNAAGG